MVVKRHQHSTLINFNGNYWWEFTLYGHQWSQSFSTVENISPPAIAVNGPGVNPSNSNGGRLITV
jgi:hypothetical protein